MTKPQLNEQGYLFLELSYIHADQLLSTFAFLMKGLAAHMVGSEEVEKDENLLELYYSFAHTFIDNLKSEAISYADIDLFFYHDINWMNKSDIESLEEALQTFFDIMDSGDWTRPDIEFILMAKEDESHSIVMKTSGTFMGEINQEDWFADVLPVVKNPKKSSSPTPSMMPTSLTDIPKLLSGQSTCASQDLDNQVPEHSVTDLVNRYLNEIIRREAVSQPLSLLQWQAVREAITGAAYLALYASDASKVVTLDDVTTVLSNEHGQSQVFAAVYLLTQSMKLAQSKQSVPFIESITTLIKYLDWDRSENAGNVEFPAFAMIRVVLQSMGSI